MGWEELRDDGGLEELVGEDEEGGGDKIPPRTGGTATGEAFGEGLVEAITAQIFPQKQNVLVKHFHHHFSDTFSNHHHSKFLCFPETNSTQHPRSSINKKFQFSDQPFHKQCSNFFRGKKKHNHQTQSLKKTLNFGKQQKVNTHKQLSRKLIL